MKLSDVSNGPDWIIWIVFALFVAISVMLLSGHGGWFVAGYNTATKEEKAKYDEKKLCRVTGIGMSVIAVIILIMGLFESVLPASFAKVASIIIGVDCAGISLVGNTICRRG